MSKIISIGIVDDNRIFVSGLVQVLEEIGGMKLLFRVRNIEELELQLLLGAETPDVCLLGFNVPDIHHYKSIEKLKASLPAAKILVMSMHTHEFNIIRLLQQGANGYISKGCTEKELHKAILSVYYSDGYFENIPATMYEPYIKEHLTFLSTRESQFLALLCSEMSYPEIATAMQLDIEAVHVFRDMLFSKLKVNSRIGLVVAAHIMGVNRTVLHN